LRYDLDSLAAWVPWLAVACSTCFAAALFYASTFGAARAERRRSDSELVARILDCNGPVWEGYVRYALRWSRKRRNRPAAEMARRGELDLGIDHKGFIYLRINGDPRKLTLDRNGKPVAVTGGDQDGKAVDA
jgi:hypothetical protein